MNATYAVIFEKADNHWAACVPDLPGCVTTGRTIEETKLNIRDAIRGYVETLRQCGAVPPPASLAGEVEVSIGA